MTTLLGRAHPRVEPRGIVRAHPRSGKQLPRLDTERPLELE
jgi:hypothetical protein